MKPISYTGGLCVQLIRLLYLKERSCSTKKPGPFKGPGLSLSGFLLTATAAAMAVLAALAACLCGLLTVVGKVAATVLAAFTACLGRLGTIICKVARIAVSHFHLLVVQGEACLRKYELNSRNFVRNE